MRRKAHCRTLTRRAFGHAAYSPTGDLESAKQAVAVAVQALVSAQRWTPPAPPSVLAARAAALEEARATVARLRKTYSRPAMVGRATGPR